MVYFGASVLCRLNELRVLCKRYLMVFSVMSFEAGSNAGDQRMAVFLIS